MLCRQDGLALPLTLIFTVIFTVLGLGILMLSSDEMKLIGNFEHGLRAFYYAEGAVSEAAAGYRHTGNAGRYEYCPEGQVAAVAQVAEDGSKIRATGRSGNITRHVEVQMEIHDGVLTLSQWKDYGLDGQAPQL